MAWGLDQDNKHVTKALLGSNPIPKRVLLPRTYTAISPRITQFNTNGYTLNFDYANRNDYFGEKTIKSLEKKGAVVVGTKKDNYVILGMDDIFYEIINGKANAIGNIMELVGGDWGKVPVDLAVMNIFGKAVPMGFIIAKHQGLKKTLDEYKVKYRLVPSNIRGSAEHGEYRIRFKDQTMYVKRGDYLADMVMSAFYNSKAVELFAMNEFESSMTYAGVLARSGVATHIYKEQEHQQKVLLDPITKEILRNMGEPDEYMPLIKRALELIATDEYPDETDPKLMRLRGYERIAGFMYEELAMAVREHANKPNPKMYSLDIKPTALWQKMVGDSTTQLKQVSNPAHAMKGQEGVSLSGHGGRDPKTLVKRSRVFHVDDVGIFSESTPDSGKVAIRTFLTPDAAINSLRGDFGEFDTTKGSTGALSSTSCLLPASNHDDRQLLSQFPTVVIKPL